MKHKNRGSSFDSFLEEEELVEVVEARIAKRLYLEQLQKELKQLHKNKSGLRKRLGSPTTVQRLFDEQNTGTELLTLVRAAAYVGKELQISLVDKKKTRKAAFA